MKIKKIPNDPTVEAIINGLLEKKGKEIVILDMRTLKSAPADFFIVAHGDSDRQVEALFRSVDETVKKMTGEDAWHTEGLEYCEWILMDYVNVVVHIFTSEKRHFYAVEELWGDAITLKI